MLRSGRLLALAALAACGAPAEREPDCPPPSLLPNHELRLAVGEETQVRAAEVQELQWRVEDPSVASFSDGILRAVGGGQTRVLARNLCGAEGSLPVFVLTRLELAPDALDLAVGEVFAVQALGDGVADVTAPARWSGADGTVVRVAASGHVLGRSAGETTVRAEWHGLSATMDVRVEDREEQIGGDVDWAVGPFVTQQEDFVPFSRTEIGQVPLGNCGQPEFHIWLSVQVEASAGLSKHYASMRLQVPDDPSIFSVQRVRPYLTEGAGGTLWGEVQWREGGALDDWDGRILEVSFDHDDPDLRTTAPVRLRLVRWPGSLWACCHPQDCVGDP